MDRIVAHGDLAQALQDHAASDTARHHGRVAAAAVGPLLNKDLEVEVSRLCQAASLGRENGLSHAVQNLSADHWCSTRSGMSMTAPATKRKKLTERRWMSGVIAPPKSRTMPSRRKRSSTKSGNGVSLPHVVAAGRLDRQIRTARITDRMARPFGRPSGPNLAQE